MSRRPAPAASDTLDRRAPGRREFLAASGALLAALAAGAAFPAAALPLQSLGALKFSRGTKFSFDALRLRAQELALQPWRPPEHPPAEQLEKIDYDAHGRLHFKTDDALFAQGPGRYPVTFFAMGRYFQTPVHMHLIDAQGEAHEIRYDPDYFDMPADSPAHGLGEHAGFAGFRLQESRLDSKLDWHHNDWAAFLGASYFRAIGGLYQYGLSARGVAVNVAESGQAEEFPAFTDFWFDTPQEGDETVILYALLDGPSISGAYRFQLTRTRDVLMEVDATLFLRRDIARLGLAPCTSMYWYSETARPAGEGSVPADWRPEVHDSDGLAMWTGNGERIWRPLNDPPRATVSAFQDRTPRGFGLMQRDRDFDHYQDGVHYERRPNLWVEPLGDWGEGAVQLVELPTDDETHDNIVAMWVPAAKAAAGSRYDLRYRLHWTADEPGAAPPPPDGTLSQATAPGTTTSGVSPAAPAPAHGNAGLARCVATRLGRGGEPGQNRPAHSTKIVVEFMGGPLATLAYGVIPQAVVSASQGTLGPAVVEPVPDGIAGHWRVRFDLDNATATGPIELRLYLRLNDAALSETWLYQLHHAMQ